MELRYLRDVADDHGFDWEYAEKVLSSRDIDDWMRKGGDGLEFANPELICLIREKTGFLRHKRRVMDCRRMAATHGDGRQLRLIPPALVRAGTPRKASYDNPYE